MENDFFNTNNEIQKYSIEENNSNIVPSGANNESGNNVVANPFGAPVVNRTGDVANTQAMTRGIAEMQAKIYLAKQFPRDQRRACDAILTACQRPGLASVAVYSYARGGSSISGPSIRLAEELARNWGNIEYSWDELERFEDSSKVRAYAWDTETNVTKSVTFIVPHYRTTRQGRKRVSDERDLYELLANQASRRQRNCILALIPGDVVESAVEQCQRTMVTSCDINPETIQRLVKAFEPFGVSRRQIENRIQRNIESITPAQFVRMREIYLSLRDGMSGASDWFEEEQSTSSATESLKNALNASKPLSGRGRKRLQDSKPKDENSAENGVSGDSTQVQNLEMNSDGILLDPPPTDEDK